MANCICDTCVHLRDFITEDGEAMAECEYGAPTETCADCELDGCEAECPHYKAVETVIVTVPAVCSMCGKKLEQYGAEPGDGPVYCVTCFLAGGKGGTDE